MEEEQTSSYEQSGGNAAAQESGGDDDAQFWKTAPKLEIPWPPGADEQVKHEIGWDSGPSYQFTGPEKKFPSDGKETLLEKDIDVQTPIPGLVLNFAAKSEYGLSFAAGAGLALKKEGEDKYSVTGNGKVTGKAAIGITGSIGVGVGAPGMSIGVAGNLEAVLEAVLEGSLQVAMVYDNGSWSGSVALPMSFMTAIKVTPSASLYVTVFTYRQELAKLTFGEWVIATAGVTWEPKANYNGGWSNETQQPVIQGPMWGEPPEAIEDSA